MKNRPRRMRQRSGSRRCRSVVTSVVAVGRSLLSPFDGGTVNVTEVEAEAVDTFDGTRASDEVADVSGSTASRLAESSVVDRLEQRWQRSQHSTPSSGCDCTESRRCRRGRSQSTLLATCDGDWTSDRVDSLVSSASSSLLIGMAISLS